MNTDMPDADPFLQDSDAPSNDDVVHIQAHHDEYGVPTAHALLTPHSDTRCKEVHSDPRPPIPVTFLPGVMGSLLAKALNNPMKQGQLHGIWAQGDKNGKTAPHDPILGTDAAAYRAFCAGGKAEPITAQSEAFQSSHLVRPIARRKALYLFQQRIAAPIAWNVTKQHEKKPTDRK